MDELKVIDLDPYLAPYKKFYLNFEQIYKKKNVFFNLEEFCELLIVYETN